MTIPSRDQRRLLGEALKLVTVELQRKQRRRVRLHRRIAVHSVFLKQVSRGERQIQRVMMAFFLDQFKQIGERLEQLDGTKDVTDEAVSMTESVYDPKEWFPQLVDVLLPVMAEQMEQTLTSTFEDLTKHVVAVELKRIPRRRTKTSASEWLNRVGLEVPPGVSVDLPQWMIRAISESLQEIFAQPFWENVLANTGKRVEKILTDGITSGVPVAEMAREIAEGQRGHARMRATRIARTESASAVNAARRAGQDEFIEEFAADLPLVTTWIAILDDRVRPEHEALDSVPEDAEGLFDVGGTRVPYPAHFDLPPEQRINCRCYTGDTLVEPLGNLVAVYRMDYDGPLVEIRTKRGRFIQVTPNHPIMTSQGLVAAHRIKNGMKLVSGSSRKSLGEDVEHEPTTIKDVFESIESIPFVFEGGEGRLQFHGDGVFGKGKVDCKVVDGVLSLPRHRSFFQDREESHLRRCCEMRRPSNRSAFRRRRLPVSNMVGVTEATKFHTILSENLNDARSMTAVSVSQFDLCGSSKILADDSAFIDRSPQRGSMAFAGASSPYRKTPGFKPVVYGTHRTAQSFGNFLTGHVFFEIEMDDVISVDVMISSSHVYDLQSSTGYYLAETVLSHNCTTVAEIPEFEL